MIDGKGLNGEEWRASDPSIARDGSMQKSNLVCELLWFVLFPGFFWKNSPCFGVAEYCGGSLSDLENTCGQFSCHLWVRVMDRQRWSLIDPMVGRILPSSNLRSRSDVLFSSLWNKLLSGHVVANAHLANLNFFEAYQVGFCDSCCTSPYACDLSGCVKWDKRDTLTVCFTDNIQCNFLLYTFTPKLAAKHSMGFNY